MPPPSEPSPFQSALLEWAPSGWRDLPWRRTRDPWAVLVSELMLQQTQVSRVVPKWQAFITRWPTAAACAAASQGEVVRAWSGLGYNRRAINLHRCAVAVAARHGGAIPADLPALLALPGVGPYTARAVLAFAFGRDVGILDTNAARVIARAAAGRPVAPTALQRMADEVVPTGRGWEWNQAVLDLGATVCAAARPACGACPLTDVCAWRRAGGPDPAVRARAQGAFAGSDRQARGRLVEALRRGPITDVARACGYPHDPERAARIVDGVVADGFATARGGVLVLRERWCDAVRFR
jgi:A/G-specific adenine glycosylase